MLVHSAPPSKRWIFKPFPDEQEQITAIESLVQTLNISPFLASLLVQRGVSTFEDARTYFRPELKHLHDPFQMRDMDRAVERITRAMDQGEKILIYGSTLR